MDSRKSNGTLRGFIRSIIRLLTKRVFKVVRAMLINLKPHSLCYIHAAFDALPPGVFLALPCIHSTPTCLPKCTSFISIETTNTVPLAYSAAAILAARTARAFVTLDISSCANDTASLFPLVGVTVEYSQTVQCGTWKTFLPKVWKFRRHKTHRTT